METLENDFYNFTAILMKEKITMPYSLFSRLIALCSPPVQFENYFTELVGYLFETSSDILSLWLHEFCDITTGSKTTFEVSTQASFEALDGHISNSRPDMMIKVSDEEGFDILFLEAKIGSVEGIDQLRRYAEILSANFPEARSRTLVFATQAYDPKKVGKICGQLPYKPVSFISMRWHAFYHFLDRTKSEAHFLAQEIVSYMKEKHMNQPNVFSEAGVTALENISDILAVMEACLQDEVKESFQAVIGPVKNSGVLGLIKNRYTLEKWFPSGGYCAIGFYFGVDNEAGNLNVRLHIGIPTNKYPDSFKALIDISKRDGWEIDDQQKPWVAVYKKSSFRQFTSADEPVLGIRSYFLSLISELAVLVPQYPALPLDKKTTLDLTIKALSD